MRSAPSRDELLEAAREDVEQLLADHVSAFIGGRWEQELELLHSLPPGLRAFQLTWELDGDVHNGGFHQYFWNMGAEHAQQTVEALRLFRAKGHAALLEEAIAVHAQEAEALQHYSDEDSIPAYIASNAESGLGALDQRYYKLTEDLSALRVAMIRRRPEWFCE
jgi:hypothetical protein